MYISVSAIQHTNMFSRIYITAIKGPAMSGKDRWQFDRHPKCRPKASHWALVRKLFDFRIVKPGSVTTD